MRVLRWVELLVSCLLLAAAGWIIYNAISAYGLSGIGRELGRVDPRKLALGIAIATGLHLFLTLYDFTALRYLRLQLPAGKVAFASLLAYVFGNNLGMANLGSGAVRFRLYSSYRLPHQKIAEIIGIVILGNWLGFLLISGMAFVLFPATIIPSQVPLDLPLNVIGGASLALVGGYLAISPFQVRPLPIRNWRILLPRGTRFLPVVAVACVDFAVPGSILYMLLPGSLDLSYGSFLSLYLLGHLVGTLSQVPGDLGIIEGAVLIGLPEASRNPAVLSAFVAYRAIYFVLPLLIALLLLGAFELRHQRSLASIR